MGLFRAPNDVTRQINQIVGPQTSNHNRIVSAEHRSDIILELNFESAEHSGLLIIPQKFARSLFRLKLFIFCETTQTYVLLISRLYVCVLISYGPHIWGVFTESNSFSLGARL